MRATSYIVRSVYSVVGVMGERTLDVNEAKISRLIDTHKYHIQLPLQSRL